MNDLLAADIVAKLFGVIDLRQGQAVHAIAGDRDRYQPVHLCDGHPDVLVAHYRRLGVTDLYVADLDGIIEGDVQIEAVEAVCDCAEGRMLIDIGWNGTTNDRSREAVSSLSVRYPNVCWIAATESLEDVSDLAEMADLVTPQRVYLGLDYKNQQLLGQVDETVWIEAAVDLGCRGAVLLDLATVGTGGGPSTREMCRRVQRAGPVLSLISGGGIRTAQDVQDLVNWGCDGCLVATALQQSMQIER